jgi:hypothetical protein
VAGQSEPNLEAARARTIRVAIRSTKNSQSDHLGSYERANQILRWPPQQRDIGKGNNRLKKETTAQQRKQPPANTKNTRYRKEKHALYPPSSAEKKLADFGTSNNIATSAFNSLINRTKMFLVSYCNLSNN